MTVLKAKGVAVAAFFGLGCSASSERVAWGPTTKNAGECDASADFTATDRVAEGFKHSDDGY